MKNKLILLTFFLLTGCANPVISNLDNTHSANLTTFKNTDIPIIDSKVEKNYTTSFEKADFKLEATTTTVAEPVLKLSGGYVLTLTFMRKLKSAIIDGILNKTELTQIISTSTLSEKAFLNAMKVYSYVTIPNLVENVGDPTTLSFIINANFNITGSFLQAINQAGIDGVLEKSEIDSLNSLGNVDEKTYLAGITKYDSYGNLPVLDSAYKLKNINLQMYYGEDKLIPSSNSAQIVSYLAQGDRLVETTTDSFRCGAGMLINASILFGGSTAFYNLSKNLGFTFSTMTYKNVHLVQDALMKKAGSPTSGLSCSYDSTGKVTAGTLLTASTAIGLKVGGTLLAKTSSSYQTSIANYFTSFPNAGLILMVNLNTTTGKIDYKATSNHYVLLTKENGAYMISDSGQRNGTALNHYQISSADLTALYTTSNKILTLSK